MMEREFNLSTAESLPEGNTVAAGKFWDPATARKQFSVETKFAEQLQWKLGDTLAFDISGQRIEGTLTSLRDVRWESFTPNFFVLASPDLSLAQIAQFSGCGAPDIQHQSLEGGTRQCA